MAKKRTQFASERRFRTRRGSVTFLLFGRFDSKAAAQKWAEGQRGKGRLARVIPAKMTTGRAVYLGYNRFE